MANLANIEELFDTALGPTYFKKKNAKGQTIYAKTTLDGAKNSGSLPVSATEYNRMRRQPTSTVPRKGR